MSGCTRTFLPVCLCLCVSAWEGVLLQVCVDTSTSMTEGCVHMLRVGRSCVGVSAGPCRLIRQGVGRVDTRVSEGTGVCTPVCTCVWTQGMGVMDGEADGPSWLSVISSQGKVIRHSSSHPQVPVLPSTSALLVPEWMADCQLPR